KGVAKPEPVVGRYLVGDVRETGRALVGGYHQIGVVVVVANDPVRRYHLVLDVVIGEVKQPAKVGPIAVDRLLGLGVAAAVGGRALDHETALGSDRHDQRVLYHLRLHQPQDLGPEILAAIRPPHATSRHLATAQM